MDPAAADNGDLQSTLRDQPRLPRGEVKDQLDVPSLWDRVPGSGTEAGKSRYILGACVGAGSTGQVKIATDRDCGRDVAIKFLATQPYTAADIVCFVDEARITAALEHTNIPPVYDLGITTGGVAWFSMRKGTGTSLGDAIAALEDGNPEARLLAIPDRVAVIRRVCDALAYAHAKGIVHRDVKPDNILIGSYGEVLLVDWGAAEESRNPAGVTTGPAPYIIGTPAFMSPEQARGEQATERSDVYCLGATLFCLLLLRPPSTRMEGFWERKRQGVIDPIEQRERRSVPRQLLAIALKAMAPSPNERYSSASAMAADLDHWRDGESVSACPDPLVVRFARWHRRHGKKAWAVLAALVAIAALVTALELERMKEYAHWGPPFLVEDFSGPTATRRWTNVSGGFTIANGGCESRGGQSNVLLYAKPLNGPTAIEFEACIDVKSPIGDLSAVWAEDVITDSNGHPTGLRNPLYLQTAAFDGTCSAISLGENRLAADPFVPQAGRWYHIRAEIDHWKLSLAVDGREICRWDGPGVFERGYIGLYGYYPGKRFRDIRVYGKTVAERLPPTSIGDAMIREGRLDSAIAAYAEVEDGAQVADLRAEAAYKRATTLQRKAELLRKNVEAERRALRRTLPFNPTSADAAEAAVAAAAAEQERDAARTGDQADAAFERLIGTRLAYRAELHRLERAIDAGDDAVVLGGWRNLWQEGREEVRSAVELAWTTAANRLCAMHDRARVALYLDFQQQLFPDDLIARQSACAALAGVGRPDEALARYGNEHLSCGNILLALGRYDELYRMPGRNRYQVVTALLDQGRFDEILREHGDLTWAVLRAQAFRLQLEEFPEDRLDAHQRAERLNLLGRSQEVLARYPDDDAECARALAALGRREEQLFRYPHVLSLGARSLIELGREQEVLTRYPQVSDRCDQALLVMAMERWWAGDRVGAETLMRRRVSPINAALLHEEIDLGLLLPFVRETAGETGAFGRAIASAQADGDNHGQRLRFAGDLLAGRISDESFLAQPHRAAARATREFLLGLRADHAGDVSAALRWYRSWINSASRRLDPSPSPVMDRFAAWRLRTLAAAP